MVSIVANMVCKNYRNKKTSIQVLKELSLTTSRGEVVALLGPNGCGKSTFLEIVAGLILPDSGEIQLDGRQPCENFQDVALVFQNYALFSWLTVIGNLEIVLEAKSIPRHEWEMRCSKYLQIFGLNNLRKMYPNQLSGGMQQKLALARALISEPKLLLLDEPFAALDAITRRKLKVILIDLIRDNNITVLLVTHSITDAIVMANRIVIFTSRPGKILSVIELEGHPSIMRTDSNDFVSLQNQIWVALNTLEHEVQ